MIPYDFKKPYHTPSFWRSIGLGYKVGTEISDNQLKKHTYEIVTHAIQREKSILFMSRDNSAGLSTHYDIKYEKKIGEGAYANIYECVLSHKTSTGRLISETIGALKLITSDSIALRDIFTEITIHAYLSKITEYVPRLYRVGFIHSPDEPSPKPFIVMEKLEGGQTLSALIKSSKTVVEVDKYVMQTFVKLGQILHYLQKTIRFVHSDLHPDNVYVKLDMAGNVKTLMLIDFGLSSIQIPHSKYRIGSDCNFVSKFDSTIDMAFLAYTLMYNYSKHFGKLLKAALRQLCSDTKNKCLLDDESFMEIVDWSTVLTTLHKMHVDKKSRSPKAVSICFQMMKSLKL